MGKFIVKLNEYYFEWSTITDSPVTFGMELEEFTDYYLAEYGHHGLSDLPARLERVDEKGSSSYDKRYWLPDLIVGNRAGPNEDQLTEKEIYWAYCLMEPIRGGWLVPLAEEV